MYKDSVKYGNGFQGAVAVKFSKMKLEIRAMGIFGRVEDYKYGMVDALVMLPGPGIPIFPPVNLNGIGGGFWYNMNSSGHETVEISDIFQDSLTTEFVNTKSLGFSLSGVQYEPEEGDWGFKITVCFIVAEENAANGNATIGISFTGDKGIDKFFVEGNIQFMTALNMTGLPTYSQSDTIDPEAQGLCAGAPIRAFIRMEMDFINNSFHSDFEAFLSVGSALRGSGPGNNLCQVQIHVDSDDWYVWFGEPAKRAGLLVEIPGGLGTIEFTTYFNLGTKLPEPALLDEKLVKFFGVQPGFTPNNKFSSGKGFMHGSTFKIDAPEKKVWILTFSANLTVGYDLALTHYDAVCQSDSEKPGFNGWYASGQLYAYMAANLGYRFKLFFKTYSGTIAGIEAGVLLRTQLPNPVWAQGVVKTKYNILGRLKGSAKFNVEFGEKCVLIGENGEEYEAELEIINYIDPGDGVSYVDVNVNPTVYFNYPIYTIIEIEDLNGVSKKYRFSLPQSQWYDEHNAFVRHKEVWNEDMTELTLVPLELLKPNTQFRLKIHATAYIDGKEGSRDTLSVYWKTGDRPKRVLMENVIESYPHVDQKHFLPGDRDANHCYAKLHSGQFYLFAERPTNARNVIQIKDNITKEVVYETELLYDCAKAQLNWIIDWLSIVQPGTKYILRGVQVKKPWVPDEEEPNLDPFSEDTDNRVIVGGYKGFPPLPPLNGEPSDPYCIQNESIWMDTLVNEFEFFTYTFTTSHYSTAEEKLNALMDSMLLISSIQNEPYVYSLGGLEGFDDYEINGHKGSPPFFKVKIVKEQSSWISSFSDFFSIRLPGMVVDCEGDTLLLSEEFQLIEDQFVQSLDWNTGFIDSFSLQNNVYEDVQFVNYLPALIHTDLKALKISYFDHLATHCDVSPVFFNICRLNHFCAPWITIRTRCENDDMDVSVNSATRIQIEYNCKPKTNKGMGVFYYNLSY